MDDRANSEPVLHLLVGDTEAEETTPDYGGGRGFPTKDQVKTAVKSLLKPVDVPISKVRPHMDELLKVVDQLFAQTGDPNNLGLVLDEVELTVEINAKGQVRILGSGVEAGTMGSIKLKFKRSPQDAG
ncbi:MAG: hypothetical protein MH825_07570 [Cyanobacteria bacterium]|nr:hypothetical protein [Cyanobacteriota bacterium]